MAEKRASKSGAASEAARIADGVAGHMKMRIDGVAHGIGRPVPVEIDMRHLRGGVHAGVGPSGGTQADRLAAELPIACSIAACTERGPSCRCQPA